MGDAGVTMKPKSALDVCLGGVGITDFFIGGRDFLEHFMGLFLQLWGFGWESVGMPDLNLGFVGPFYIFNRCARLEL